MRIINAAIRIQKVVRGWIVRRGLKRAKGDKKGAKSKKK